MKTPIRFLAMLFGSLLLVAGHGRAFACAFCAPAADTVKIAVSSNSIGTNTTATLTVTVTRPNGSAETDGTVLSATVTPATIGTVAGVSTSTSTTSGSTSSLVGGVASFVFVANSTLGTATVTFSLPPVNGHPTTVTASTQITVVQGDGINPSLQLTTATPTLPLNPYSLGAQEDGSSGFPTNYLGSPYIAEVTVQWRGLITGALENGTVNVAIAPTTVAAYSTLDDPTTDWSGETASPVTVDGNEFLTLMGSGTVDVTAGVGTIYVHAGNVAGTATLTVTATDPDTNKTISSQLTITVAVPPGSDLPTAVTLSQASGGLYVNNSNGAQSKLVYATVTNIYDAPVIADTGIDNIQFDIVGPSGIDAKLYAVSATGVPQIGSSVKTAGSGGAYVYLLAGSVQGLVQIRATVDAADGNVDNGIATPITATTTVAVSDGQLYSLTITSPVVNAIAVNGITASSGTSTTTDGGVTIPQYPDGTYSLTVSAIATDREGNPVLPGTEIKFGLIDGPQDADFAATCSGLGAFQICGTQGSPQPGAVYFSAPDGKFKTAGGGAGPGDTLVVFGKQWHGAPAGNDDLESALSITSIVSNTQLFTLYPFNRNDTTGTSVLPGALPYVIGRATIGTINSPVTTDSTGNAIATGTATTTLNYPVSKLNRSVVIWAQGTGPDTAYKDASGNPTTRLVTDAIVTTYPGVADLIVSASPNPIPGNVTITATVCVTDALQIPIPGLRFNFAFSNLGAGSGTVDGTSTSGWTGTPTDSSGCADATVYTNGIASSSSSSSGTPTLTFTAPGYAAGSSASVAIPITAGGDLVLLASPSALGGTGGTVNLTLLTSNGTAVPGVQLTGTCTGDTVSLDSGPGTTSTSGQTSATISASLNGYGTAGSGTCTFTTASGSPTATVNLKGADQCVSDPTNSLCTTSSSGSTTGNALTLVVDATAATIDSSITDFVTASLGSSALFSPSNSSTATCSVTAGLTNTCVVTVPTTVTSVALHATAGTGNTFSQWQTDCSSSAGVYASTTTIPISGAITCTATFITTSP
ncbi:MAG: hypothetical protein QM741_06285 [Rudaea sp.]|uniref:beta strand repeat-containing protein n=1 Tax=Rudaea sp. TaxID=2136325 RepID=UPI0039E48A15